MRSFCVTRPCSIRAGARQSGRYDILITITRSYFNSYLAARRPNSAKGGEKFQTFHHLASRFSWPTFLHWEAPTSMAGHKQQRRWKQLAGCNAAIRASQLHHITTTTTTTETRLSSSGFVCETSSSRSHDNDNHHERCFASCHWARFAASSRPRCHSGGCDCGFVQLLVAPKRPIGATKTEQLSGLRELKTN